MSKIKMPDPVAYIDEYGFLMSFSTEPENDVGLITTDQAEAYAKAVRDEAVKRARPTYYGDGYQAGWNSALDKAADLVGGSSMTSRHAAAAIRALKREQS